MPPMLAGSRGVAVTLAIAPAQPRAATPLSYRKDVARLRGPQLAALRNAYAASKARTDDRGFFRWAGIHGLPLPISCQHHTQLFLPWHRAYLYFFELSLKRFEPTVTLPWWDWTSSGSHSYGVPHAYAAAQVDGGSNPLAAGGPIAPQAVSQGGQGAPTIVSRNHDEPARLPTAHHVNRLLGLGDFLDFQQQLEQVHDEVHVWLGGTMSEIPFAAYDPLFFAHHAMIDRIWRLWQMRHPTSVVPHSLLNEALDPFHMTVAETIDVNALGYDYAAFSSRTVIDSGGGA
jgi:tyrosinase